MSTQYQDLINRRRDLNRTAQETLKEVAELIGTTGFSRTQEIRLNQRRITLVIADHDEMVAGTASSYMKSNYKRRLEELNIPSMEGYTSEAYMIMLKQKQQELNNAIRQEFPEKADEVQSLYRKYEKLMLESNMIKTQVNSSYGR